MKRVYSHNVPHQYWDVDRRTLWSIGANSWREVPDEVADYICAGHPLKLCDVSGEVDPSLHHCEKGGAGQPENYTVSAISAPPLDRQEKPAFARKGLKRVKRRGG